MGDGRQFRMILAGCGSIAGAWVDAVAARPDCQLVGLVDPVPGQAVGLAERKDLSCPVFTELSDALAAVDARVVLDVTPPTEHRTIATLAAEAGCAVLAEKPLALSLSDGLAIARLMDKAGLFYAVMQNRRYYPGLQALRAAVADGVLGEVSLVAVELFLRGRPRAGRPARSGFRDAIPQILLWDMGIHAFDAARTVLGRDAVAASAQTGNPPWARQSGDTMASCTFEMDGGATFWYRGALWGGPAPNNFNGVWRAIGSQGTAYWDGRSDVAQLDLVSSEPPGDGLEVYEAPPRSGLVGHGDHHDTCFDEMMTALASGAVSATAIGDNLRSVAMVEAAIASAQQGRRVALDDDGRAGLGEPAELGEP